jgi:hypothetical protein
MSGFRAGFAKRCVTPSSGTALAGYGLRPERKVGAVLDDLFVRAFVFDDGANKVAMITADIIAFSEQVSDAVAARIEKETGIPRQAVLFSAIHNHSAPTAVFLRNWGEMSPAYIRLFMDRTVGAAVAADKNLKPVSIGFGQTQVPGIAVNRVRADGPADNTLRVLGLRDEETQTLSAAAVHFSCHPVCMLHDSAFVPADYPGRLIRDLERVFPGHSAAFLQGSAGDINPVGVHKGADFAQDHGRALAAAAQPILEGLKFERTPALSFAQNDCELPLDWEDAKREATAYLYQGKIRNDHEWLAQSGFLREWAKQILGPAAANPPNYLRCRIGALRLGQTALLGCRLCRRRHRLRHRPSRLCGWNL